MNKIFKVISKLKSKTQLTENIFEFKYTVPYDFVFSPGQFVTFRFAPNQNRAYSIVSQQNGLISLLIDINVNESGLACRYFNKVKIGDELNLMGPYGIFTVKTTPLNKVFVSTGTGIAPFIPMIKNFKRNNLNVEIIIFFGVSHIKNDIAYEYFANLIGSKLKYILCVTKDLEFNRFSKIGRVTQVISTYNLDWLNTEFYLCGSNQMINDTVNVLKEKQVNKIYFEKYG